MTAIHRPVRAAGHTAAVVAVIALTLLTVVSGCGTTHGPAARSVTATAKPGVSHDDLVALAGVASLTVTNGTIHVVFLDKATETQIRDALSVLQASPVLVSVTNP